MGKLYFLYFKKFDVIPVVIAWVRQRLNSFFAAFCVITDHRIEVVKIKNYTSVFIVSLVLFFC